MLSFGRHFPPLHSLIPASLMPEGGSKLLLALIFFIIGEMAIAPHAFGRDGREGSQQIIPRRHFSPQNSPEQGDLKQGVMALVERAVKHLQQVDKKKAYEDFSTDARFRPNGLYIFCYDTKGVTLADGARPLLIGRSLLAVRDAKGQNIIAAMLALVTPAADQSGVPIERGWVKFLWPNALTKKLQERAAFVQKTSDGLCGAAYFTP
jgi:cytochrome c